MAIDKALYLTNQVYQEAQDAGYHCYAMSAGTNSGAQYVWGPSFMEYLAGGNTVTFESIQNDILYLLGPGSTIVDEIGNTSDYNFDLVVPEDKCPFTLTVGGTPYVAKADGDNAWKFYATQEDADNANNYKFQIAYDKTDTTKETIIWNINTNVSNLAPVQLTYTVKLTNPKTDSGTYGKYDQYGKNKYDGLYTNNSAVLYPVDSQDNDDYLPDEFLKPTVSYTVSGGHNGGGSTKPPVLNTEDHYGYIIGYPVDYYTGEKTNDQTRMPVKPEGNITRAEVATIFFRMLTDESRTEFWSQTSSYSDVEADDWFNNAICTLSKAGILSGYEDGSFHPNGKITRAEFATIASRFFEYADENIENPFSDVEEGAWYYKYIMAASEMGLINGYPDGTFGPEKLITRAEAVTIVNRTLDRHPDQDHFLKDMLVWVDNMDTSKWYYEAMQEATNSHEYEMKGSGGNKYENWTKMLPIRDWAAFEKEWSDANSASGGEVVK
ncbi:S-layer homology domain-containing protein [Evtepia sp.]|uniref:S-layer homology domain-containing protein n=1 Tax=Evtepia sp. TaxID=2773933 RepID=UPI003F159F95